MNWQVISKIISFLKIKITFEKFDIEAKQELLDKFDAKLAKELNTFREGISP